MTWILRVLLLVMAFFLIRKVATFLFGGWFAPAPEKRAARARPGSKAIEGRMVKDPQCGMYVASSLAVALDSSEQKLYFCSDDCRDTYLRERQLEEVTRS